MSGNGSRADSRLLVVTRLREIRTRADHRQGYRLFDYRPDVLALPDAVERLGGGHYGVTIRRCRYSYCAGCLHAWPCPSVRALAAALALVISARSG